jgi:hypothetical protein
MQRSEILDQSNAVPGIALRCMRATSIPSPTKKALDPSAFFF